MIKHIETVQEYDEIIANNELVLVDFFATWCGPCKMLAPVLEEVDEKQLTNAKIIKVDTDEFIEIARRYNIQAIPTLILFKNGVLSNTSLGYLNKNQVISFINK